MKRLGLIVFIAMVTFALGHAWAQTINVSLSGTVEDSSRALMTGVLITATNTQTGIVTKTTSNNEGVYEFPSIQSGTYEITAELQGFQRSVYKDVVLQVSAKVRMNFTLQVATLENSVEVDAALDSPLAMTTTSVGGVLTSQKVEFLPVESRSALDLVSTSAGVVGADIGGGRTGSTNITRDGINVADTRGDWGLRMSMLFTSVDLVDEMRVIVAPADAELGRGSGQVQISTKSGTNEFHGSVFEAVRNTALNANTFFNNLRNLNRDVLKRNQFGGRLGGPIIKNKTFFFFLYEGQRERSERSSTANVFTSTARQDIFRFFPGVRNGNANSSVPTVDLSGNPVKPASATGDLVSVNLLGRDPYRPVMDPSGTMQKLIADMPQPNDFRVGDGLNTAGYTFRQPGGGNRDQYNIRIDHNISEKHRASGIYTYEKNVNISRNANLPGWPRGTGGSNSWYYSISLTSTLKPTIVNEARVGANHPETYQYDAWMLPSGQDLLPKIGGSQLRYGPTLVTTPYGSVSSPGAAFGNASPFYSYSDTVTWIRGAHAIKFGVEYRLTNTNGWDAPGLAAIGNFGAGGVPVTGVSDEEIPGLGANESTAQNMLIDLSASLSNVTQGFNVTSTSSPEYLPNLLKTRDWHNRELSMFVKDDLKVGQDWTFNLGVRWDYYSVPWEKHGLAVQPIGQSAGMFGISGTGWADLYQPGHLNGSLTKMQFVGKNSSNPDVQFYKDDWNNFGPAVGASWSIPYFGKGKTVLRAGYSITYPKQSLIQFDDIGGYGLFATALYQPTTYLDLAHVQLPLATPGQPLAVIPLNDRTQTLQGFDDNMVRPYVQSWNVSLQRELSRQLTLEVRYIGTKGTKLQRGTDINEANIFENGILDAFLVTQAGGNAPLLDSIFQGLDLGLGPVNGTTVTGSASVRKNSTTRKWFANNNVGDFANYLNTSTNYTGKAGGLLRRAGLPENFVVANPQYADARYFGSLANSTYHAMQVEVLKRFSNSWTLTANYTWSKTLGEGDAPNALYSPYRNGRDWHTGKRLEDYHRTHSFKTNGSYELPFGPGKKFFAGSSGLWSRLLEHWQFAWIFGLSSGSPITISSATTSFNQYGSNNTATAVAAFSKDIGSVQRTGTGVVYFSEFKQVPDPGIASLTSQQGLAGSSTMLALADSSGKVIFVNPTPGKLGTVALNCLEGPTQFNFDFNLVKRVRVREQLLLEFRLDAMSVLNHPVFGNPNTNINSTNFGNITSASGNRVLVVNIRLSF
jgi:hypothetical protein